MRSIHPLLCSVAFLAACVLSVKLAPACGGFFCSRTPVDQTAERIIFRVNPNGTITAFVQITYSGERDAFAWVVPVPSDPVLEVGFPDRAMQALDLATEPRYFQNYCGVAETSASAGGGPPRTAADDGVTVLDREIVGPFDTVTLEGRSAELLVGWLQDNGYRINDNMVPFIQPYVDEDMKFVAMRLEPDSSVEDIEPIILTYEGMEPMIPIRLTTVAAQPEMGIVALILGEQRYAPDEYVDLKIPDELIRFDGYAFRNNYLAVVSREVDRVGGQAFVTEYSGPTSALLEQFENAIVPDDPEAQAANQAVLELLRESRHITRLYTRMSAEEMTRDPTFVVAKDQSEVDNVHDLTDPDFDFSQCEVDPPPPCDFTYCGRRGVCVESAEGLPACVCADAATARPVTTGGAAALYCEPVAFNFMAADESAVASGPGFGDACENFDCGEHGECITMNGNPTCACEGGHGAVLETEPATPTGAPSISIRCQALSEEPPAVPDLPQIPGTDEPGPWSPDAPAGSASEGGGCSTSGAARTSSAFGMMWGALLAGLARRRVYRSALGRSRAATARSIA